MRFERSHVLFAGFVVLGIVVIATSLATSEPGSVERLLTPAWWPHAVAYAVTPAAAVGLVAWLTRLVFILSRAALTIRRLPTALEIPPGLTSSLARTGVQRVRCIEGTVPIAFCAGAVLPEVVVSECLAEQLDPHELDAVLLHELHHLREREPMVRAAFEAAAQVLFFLPVARWWARRRIEQAELRADQAAVREVGPRPVATALYRLGTAMPSTAPFGGVAELRVAQLLGDPLPVRRPPAGTVVTSLLTLPFVLAVTGSGAHLIVMLVQGL